MNKDLARIINKMASDDQVMRRQIKRGGVYNEALDRKNTEKLKKIVREYGWPTIHLVGGEASHNAWLLAQHADHDMRFQKKILELMQYEDGINPGSVRKNDIAYLMDRVLLAEGKEQEFGTQLRRDASGTFKPEPIRNSEEVDVRRAEYGLSPLEQYIKEAEMYLYGRNTDKG